MFSSIRSDVLKALQLGNVTEIACHIGKQGRRSCPSAGDTNGNSLRRGKLFYRELAKVGKTAQSTLEMCWQTGESGSNFEQYERTMEGLAISPIDATLISLIFNEFNALY